MKFYFHPDAKEELDGAVLSLQPLSRTLRIIAVAHLHRRPGYWKERIEQNK